MTNFSINDSILISTKNLLGISDDCDVFDQNILININSAILSLRQIGVGPESGFFVFGKDETFLDLLGKDFKDAGAVSMYLFCKTKLGFDSPSSVAYKEFLKEQIKEIEWRLVIENDLDPSTVASSDPDNLEIDYRKLKNLPKINNQTLIDNYNEIDPLSPKTEIPDDKIINIWTETKK